MIIHPEEQRRVDQPGALGGKGVAVFQFLVEPERLKGEAKMFNIVELPPGASLGWHGHTDNFELYYILEGEALVNDNGEESTVHPGDLIYTADGAHHSIENVSNQTMKMIATVIFENQ